MLFTNQFTSPGCATLEFLIGHVVLVRSKKKMFGINTDWVIAVMQYLHPSWDYSFSDRPSIAMCPEVNPLGLKNAISIWVQSPPPDPAFLCSIDAQPKSILRISVLGSSLLIVQTATASYISRLKMSGGSYMKLAAFAKALPQIVMGLCFPHKSKYFEAVKDFANKISGRFHEANYTMVCWQQTMGGM